MEPTKCKVLIRSSLQSDNLYVLLSLFSMFISCERSIPLQLSAMYISHLHNTCLCSDKSLQHPLSSYSHKNTCSIIKFHMHIFIVIQNFLPLPEKEKEKKLLPNNIVNCRQDLKAVRQDNGGLIPLEKPWMKGQFLNAWVPGNWLACLFLFGQHCYLNIRCNYSFITSRISCQLYHTA